MLERRQQLGRDRDRGRDVHRGREAVVRRLAHVDVIVRMDRRFLCRACRRASRWRGWRSPRWRSCSTACRSRSARRRAGIARRACRRSLPARPSTIAFARLASRSPSLLIDLGGRPLDDAERAHDRRRHAFAPIGKFSSERCVCAPHRRSACDLDRTERIGLDAHIGHVGVLGSGGSRAARLTRRVYFLRKRSSRTTSPPFGGRFRRAPSRFALGGRGRRRSASRGALRGLFRARRRWFPSRSPAAPDASFARRGAASSAAASASLGAATSNSSAELHRRIEEAPHRVERDHELFRDAVERQTDFDSGVGDREIPELVLQHDGHFFRVLRLHARRDFHARRVGVERDEEMMLARQPVARRIGRRLGARRRAAPRAPGDRSGCGRRTWDLAEQRCGELRMPQGPRASRSDKNFRSQEFLKIVRLSSWPGQMSGGFCCQVPPNPA